MCEEPVDPDLAAFEAALLPLVPSPSTVDRDRLMFLAGQASGRRRRRAPWLWFGTALAATVAAGVLGVMLATRPQPGAVERIVYVASPQPDVWPQGPDDRPGATPSSPGGAPSSAVVEYFRLRRLVLAHGIGAIPEPQLSSAPGNRSRDRMPSYQEILKQIMKG